MKRLGGRRAAPSAPTASHDSGSPRALLPRYLAAYLCWFALSVLGLWAALQARLAALALIILVVARDRAGDTVTATGQVRSLDNLITVVLALIWLGGTVLLEAHLREAVPPGRVLARVARVLAALVVVIALAYGLRALL